LTPSTRPSNTWPDEDQLHHFAGYFYLGAFIKAFPVMTPVKQKVIEQAALFTTGDWPKHNNPGDYDLGLVADDIGQAFELDPGYSGSQGSPSPTIRIWQDLTSTSLQAFLGDGRTVFP
jgi:hypothetical protein